MKIYFHRQLKQDHLYPFSLNCSLLISISCIAGEHSYRIYNNFEKTQTLFAEKSSETRYFLLHSI